jgi:chromosome segregation ATPase
MAREMVGIRDAVRGWHVSERALRRRLATGEVDEVERAEDGSWLMSSEWLDKEFDRSVIDLRDPAVSDGLAAVLAEITQMTDRVTEAEVRAAVAESERDTAAAKLRSTTDDLEAEQTERQRLEHDFHQLQTAHAVQTERLEKAQAEIDRAWAAWQESESASAQQLSTAQKEIHRLGKQVDRSTQKLRLVESLVSRRKRARYEQLLQQID